jgi:hypothetical protein
MMVKHSLALVCAVAVTACASYEQNHTAPYCYTDQTITQTNKETVSSTTTLQCTDRPGQQTAIQRAGIDSGCEEFWYPELRGSTRVLTRGVRCEKLDGSWEIVDIDGNTR